MDPDVTRGVGRQTVAAHQFHVLHTQSEDAQADTPDSRKIEVSAPLREHGRARADLLDIECSCLVIRVTTAGGR